MNGAALEALLARLYSDADLLAAYLRNPDPVLREAGLDEEATRAMRSIDLEALAMAAGSYAKKRASHAGKTGAGRKRGWAGRT